MTTRTNDHPDVLVFPPLIIAGTLVAALFLQWLCPLDVISQIGAGARIALGAFLIVAGAAVTVGGRLALMRHGTNVNPQQPTTALVTSGVYGWTRNPMYTGVAPIMVGVALVFALDWLIILIVPSYCILHFAVVQREERYLEQKFGDEYRRYRVHVPRYIAFARGQSAAAHPFTTRQ
jgi:protein-S-isoprenylcysteine O-methyltransferase Ste14